MKIGMLGTGEVGQVLGSAFVTLGHEVCMGGRDAGNEKATAWAKQAGPSASHGTFADAAHFGEVLVLATLGQATLDILEQAGPLEFSGKIVLDATNPLDFSHGFPPTLFVGTTDSLGEQIQRKLAGAHVVKCFNTVGNVSMFQPQYQAGPPTMFICGDDDGAKATVTALLRDFGWEAADLGDIRGARAMEPLCLAWVLYGVKAGTWLHAFRMLRR